MSPLLSILRAAHCRSTHHYFAIDSLRLVQTEPGMRLRGILLKHHERYLSGAKDPDERFRDFQNHVVHVQDGYFGGAPRLAMRWYDRLLGHLVSSRYEDAAYAMGVLSHYFTDPLMPLHTAQSEREALVHRPMEWSICKSYDRILKCWTEDELRLVFQLGDGDGWLGEAIMKGARFANRSYKRLVQDYDVDLGSDNPVAGLNQEAIKTFAELFGLSITGLARIVERAAGEAETRCGNRLPVVGLSAASLFATLQIPEHAWRRWVENKAERLAIQDIVTEYRMTGKVIEHMPNEVYIKNRVMEVREREKQWGLQRHERLLAKGSHAARIVATVPGAETTANNAAPTLDQIVTNNETVVSLPFESSAKSAGLKNPRIHRACPLVDAPSIGPKTAAHFSAIQVFTIGEFLDLPAASMSRRIRRTWITTTVIEAWQAQTRLMCDIPGLLTRDVQMLVSVGCRSTDDLILQQPLELAGQMAAQAQTPDGRRMLHGAPPATADDIARWIISARLAKTKAA